MASFSFSATAGPGCFEPVEHLAAGGQRLGLPGLVWLDSAVAGPRSISLLAACPDFLRRGSATGWLSFEADVARFQETHPGGAVIGWIEYGGAYQFGFYPQPLFYSHGSNTWSHPGGKPDWLERAAQGSPPTRPWRASLEFALGTEQTEFCRRVGVAKEHIAAGDIYQVNLSHRLKAVWPQEAEPFALYLKLRAASPAPQAAYLALDKERTVLSSSPEEFLTLHGQQVETRPIKGTRPRGSSDRGDEAAAAELLASEKERAELLMITDLLRNDLGQFCEYGSVWVEELFRVERYAQVFHLVSTIKGRLRGDVTHPQALNLCSPGGSITGAPKRRAREIIASLEDCPRGLYTGAIGAFLPDRKSRFSIAIRTVIVENGEAHFHVGAGIVADSNPSMEWEETLHKAAGILRAGQV